MVPSVKTDGAKAVGAPRRFRLRRADEGVIRVLFVAGLASVPDRLSNGSDVRRRQSYTGRAQKKKANFF